MHYNLSSFPRSCVRMHTVLTVSSVWVPTQERGNQTKHSVSFEQAAEVFLDPLQLSILDDEHNEQEQRWITLGNTKAQQLRLVVHTFITYHQDEVTVRIISARPATRHEQKQYEDA